METADLSAWDEADDWDEDLDLCLLCTSLDNVEDALDRAGDVHLQKARVQPGLQWMGRGSRGGESNA